MSTIALIGGDGAGKSTISDMLLKEYPSSLKYIYMGISIDSSNIALPTSRIIQFCKKNLFFRKQNTSSRSEDNVMGKYYKDNLGPDKRGKLGATFRLVYRLSEEYFRLIKSYYYQLRGQVVLYDRFFLFDFYKPKNDLGNERLSERIHVWCLNNLYPKPDIVILLDAPPEVLFQRKGEYSVNYLKRKREEYLSVGKKMPYFVRIDATLPVINVFSKVVSEFIRLKPASKLGKNATLTNVKEIH
jgi:thymidylate kinase